MRDSATQVSQKVQCRRAEWTQVFNRHRLKTYCALRSAYSAVFLSAAWSVVLVVAVCYLGHPKNWLIDWLIDWSPAPVAAMSTYDPASVLATVTSHRRGLPLCHGIRDNPSGRFPSCLFRPDGGSLTAGTSAALMARKIMSLSTLCLGTLPVAFLQTMASSSSSSKFLKWPKQHSYY